MASDIKLNENAVVVEGNVGVGTNNPARPLHVEGNEIHSGGPGAGFSFSDRTKPGLVNNPQNGERWVWYAHDEAARLWSGEDVMTVNRHLKSWRTELKGDLLVEDDIMTSGTVRGKFRGVAETLQGREMGPQKIRAVACLADAIHLHKQNSDPRFAFFHEFADLPSQTKKDALVVNYQGSYKDGVRIDGNVQVNGVLTHASSIALKENVAQLSSQEATAALQGLSTVKFTYKADEQKEQHVGFIAENVPDLVAKGDRKAVSAMDIVGVLTKVVQEQQKMLADLALTVNGLKQRNGGA